jgi:hypothetical protein
MPGYAILGPCLGLLFFVIQQSKMTLPRWALRTLGTVAVVGLIYSGISIVVDLRQRLPSLPAVPPFPGRWWWSMIAVPLLGLAFGYMYRRGRLGRLVVFTDPDGRRWRYGEIARLSEAEMRRLMERRPDVWDAYGRAISDAMGPPGRIGKPWK